MIPHFRRITDACHEHGAVMIQQLYHVGAHGDFDLSCQPNWSPSGLPSMHDQDGSHAMTAAEIEELVEGFAQAARRAREAGFDGCEIMAAEKALIGRAACRYKGRRGNAQDLNAEVAERQPPRSGPMTDKRTKETPP